MMNDRSTCRRSPSRSMPGQPPQRRSRGVDPYGHTRPPVAPAQPFRQNYDVYCRQNYVARRKANSFSTALVALALVAVVGFAGWFSFQAIQGTLPVADAAGRTDAGRVQSTPKSEWKQGSMPLLFQTDPAWSDARYAESNFGETGCGPTCMAMVYAGLTGKTDRDPASLAAFATERGYAGPDGTAWLFMTEGAETLGLSATDVPADEGSIRREIIAGRPIIASMGPGDFTTTGHFIVITGIDRDSKLIVHDPNSPERSARSWDFDTVIGQCRALWSYSLV